jgi:hypothetical protein
VEIVLSQEVVFVVVVGVEPRTDKQQVGLEGQQLGEQTTSDLLPNPVPVSFKWVKININVLMINLY